MAKFNRGFTLIELMITVAIIGIIAAIAYPSYTDYVVKSRRTSAEACLNSTAQYLERVRSTTMTYVVSGGIPTQSCELDSDLDSYYAFFEASDGTALGAGSYTITARAIGVQAERDAGCTRLAVTDEGVETPAGCW